VANWAADSGAAADVSIVAIIPLYNGARFIEQSIRSVLDQTRQPDEFIVIDDGSSDGGAGIAIVERLQRDHPQITLLHKDNGGQSSARNFGVANSKSALIAFLDQDDLWYPHHLDRLVRPFIEKSPIPLGWAYSNLDEIDEGGSCVQHGCLDLVPSEHPKDSLAKCLSHDMYVLPSASLIARQAFETVGGFDERLIGYEDDDLFVRLFRAGFDNVYLNERLSQWRLHSNSASFGERMAVSRMIYARKLIAMFPQGRAPLADWTRDCVVPRFMKALKADHRRYRRAGNAKEAARFSAEIAELVSYLPRRTRVRLTIKLLGRRFVLKTTLPRTLILTLIRLNRVGFAD
jgi:glycosyltransferase involved in cell wall biosynthesis